MPDKLNLQKIFSAPDVKHGLSLFNSDEINAIKRLIIEQEGKETYQGTVLWQVFIVILSLIPAIP